MVMKVVIERDRCTSCSDCVLSVPEVFDLDDRDAKVVLLQIHPSEDLRPNVERAVDDCPTNVIHLVEE
ncbi:ferredoxin [Arthrobacter pascens]|nr:ferredoxin [Arthrobacter pascens]